MKRFTVAMARGQDPQKFINTGIREMILVEVQNYKAGLFRKYFKKQEQIDWKPNYRKEASHARNTKNAQNENCN